LRIWAVYGALALGTAAIGSAGAQAPTSLAVEARAQYALKDRPRDADAARAQLAELSRAALERQDPLAAWIDYWALGARLKDASQDEVDAFYARWRGSYVEDRLRNDWLLELGRRQDWPHLLKDYAAFRMRDDREVDCYVQLAGYRIAPRDASPAAMRDAWLAQRAGDDGCALLASTLRADGRIAEADLWLRLRLAVQAQKPRAIKQTADLLGAPIAKSVAEIQDKAGKYLERHARAGAFTDTRVEQELTTLALLRVAASDPGQAADLLGKRWERRLPGELAAWVWLEVARQSSANLDSTTALDAFGHGLERFDPRAPKAGADAAYAWSRETLGAIARAALRAGRWDQLLTATELMPAAEQKLPNWQYWRARALLATLPAAPAGAASGAGGGASAAPGDAAAQSQRERANALLSALASAPQAGLDFYGRLAAEDLGRDPVMPAAAPPPTPDERARVAALPGLQRAQALLALDLRNEALREWNFTMRDLDERALLAAADLACTATIWDRCISSSERMRGAIDLAQRYPTPYRDALVAEATAAGIDPAYVYGLIRQESRFYMGSRSAVGAHGLMQVMPDTARWIARKAGLPFDPATLGDTEVNLRIGTAYLRYVLANFDASLPLAAAAYNAGPARPRRWRQGDALDAAVWVETIPFYETRDYVRNVLVNTLVYRQRLGAATPTLHALLGGPIGPPVTPAATGDAALPPKDQSQ